MVDDGSKKELGREIDFRAKLENVFKTFYHITTVLLVVNGGPETFRTVAESLEKEIPVVLLSVRKYIKFNKNLYF